MHELSLGRGRKKAVARFRTRQGLAMLGTIFVAVVAIAALFLMGVLRVD